MRKFAALGVDQKFLFAADDGAALSDIANAGDQVCQLCMCVCVYIYVANADGQVPQLYIIYVSSYCCICVLILLYMCPHTAMYVSSY